jgi:hypothetical protein
MFQRLLRVTVVAAALVTPGCGVITSSSDDHLSISAATSDRVLIVEESEWRRFPSDLITIAGTRFVGDTLVLSVTHGGGCRDHAYQLLAGTVWMESLPVQVAARLSHDANGDMCRALLSRDVKVNLTPLRDAYRRAYGGTTGKIALRLEGAPAAVVYEF